MPETEPLLVLDHVDFAYPISPWRSALVLHDVSLKVYRGEAVAIVGPSAAGKSTLLKIALGLLEPVAGTARIDGRPAIAALRLCRVAYLPEGLGLPLNARVSTVLAAHAHALGLDVAEARRKAENMLPRGVIDRRVHECSAGSRVCVALAATLMGDPEIVVLDEPLAMLDLHLRDAVIELLRQAVARGATLLISSHHLAELPGIASRVVLLADGRIRAEASADEIFGAPYRKGEPVRAGSEIARSPEDWYREHVTTGGHGG